MNIEAYVSFFLTLVALLWIGSKLSKFPSSFFTTNKVIQKLKKTIFSKRNEALEKSGDSATVSNSLQSRSRNGETTVKLLPIPEISLFKDSCWLVSWGNWRAVNLLLRKVKPHRIFTYNMWMQKAAIINDIQLGKEAFRNPAFCGRPLSALPAGYSPGLFGMIANSGKVWREQRGFCHLHLKNLGFGTKSMESYLQDEVDQVIESWSNLNGQVFSPNKSFYGPVLNSIWRILSGEKASAQDQKFVDLIIRVYRGFAKQYNFLEMTLQCGSWKRSTLYFLSVWTPFFPGVYEFKKSCDDLRCHFKNFIAGRHEALTLSSNEESTPHTMVDAYLHEIKNTADPTSEFYKDKGMEHLLAVMVEFFIAGGDTTATMLQWAMLELIRNPEIQQKIRQEVDAVVGLDKDSSSCLQDRNKCPYTEAFLWELLRRHPVASACIPHATTENTKVGPYFVPKGAGVVLNIYGIQHDVKVWGDPEIFRPERFLTVSSDGVLTFVKHEAMCAFSLGLRKCFGEQMAKDNLFLFISSICHKFILKPDPTLKELPSVLDTKSFVHVPQTFTMMAVPRFT